MKKLVISALAFAVFLLINCKSDDNSPEIIMDQETMEMDEVPVVIISKGVFLDAPVQGLTYSYSDKTGKTDADGTFEYLEGETVAFKVGGVIIGELTGKEVVSPLDFVENGTINSQEVRNIASFFQSLDADADPSNGILIDDKTNATMAEKTLDFSSDDFSIALKDLVVKLNEANGSYLVLVNSNEAANHLAESLDKQSEFEFLPRIIQGREWEEGEYFNYNTSFQPDQYVFKIGSDLTGVRYNFGDGFGFYMDMTYEFGKLSGFGNFYNDIDAESPMEPNPTYEYRNRVMSPGYVMDYNGDTFLGYNNYFKKSGDLGKIEGTYEAFFYYENKRVDQEPETQFVVRKNIVIAEANSDGDFPATLTDYDIDDNVTNELVIIIGKEDINDENILLIRFQDTDYIFINNEASLKYFSPGILTTKKK